MDRSGHRRIPNNEWGKTVRFGRKLTVATYADLGPGVADPAKQFAGSDMSCRSCQEIRPTFRRGLRRFSAVSLTRRRSRHARRADHGCMTRSLNSCALPVGSDEMKAFVAYIEFLSADRPIGAKALGRGSGEMAERTRPADSLAAPRSSRRPGPRATQ
jgi:thiosulfate dehydrogenase